MSATYAAGDPCPDCRKPMVFDGGDEMSRDHPGEPACVFCTDCGMGYPVDWERTTANCVATPEGAQKNG